MRTATSLRLLLVPAALLLAAGCDDQPDPAGPQEPPAAADAVPTRQDGGPTEAGPGYWADGYLFGSSPLTPSYIPAASYSFNRSGGVMTITKPAGTTGRYVARFSGLSALLGTRSTVHVTGYTNGAISSREDTYCKPVAARLAGDSVEVRCFRIGTGTPVDATFTLLALGRREDRAFAYAHQPTATDYSPAAAGSWNFFGTSRVYRNAVGQYRVVFNGFGTQLTNVGGHVQVNAVGTSGAHCNAYNFGTGGSPNLFVDVRCYKPTGAPVDTKFTVLFVLPAPHLAYAWADKPSAASYSPLAYYGSNPTGGAITITHDAVGKYRVEWAGVDPEIFDGGNVQVTSYGNNTQCKVTEQRDSSARIQCFAPNGTPMDSRYTVLLGS